MAVTIALSSEQIAELTQGSAVKRTVGAYDNPLSLVVDKGKETGDKYILVEFEFVSGEFGQRSHVVIQIRKRQSEDKAVHEYFRDYYGENGDCCEVEEKGRLYYYHGAQIAVKIQGSRLITEAQYLVLKSLGMAF